MAGQATSTGLLEAVAALLREGRREAADQYLLRRWPKLSSAARTTWARQMTEACRDAGDAVRARRWLRRMPQPLALIDLLHAARLAGEVGDALRAHEWFEQVLVEQGSLDERDGLLHGLAALQAAERMRLPRGRQGSWRRHLALLLRARELLVEVSRSARDPEIVEAACGAADRAASLLGSKVPPD